MTRCLPATAALHTAGALHMRGVHPTAEVPVMEEVRPEATAGAVQAMEADREATAGAVLPEVQATAGAHPEVIEDKRLNHMI